MSLVTGDHQPMWVRLDGWLVQDGSVKLVDVGSVLSDAAVCAIGQTVQPALYDADGVESIPFRDATSTGMAAYRVTGVAGPAQQRSGVAEDGLGASFLLTMGTQPFLVDLWREVPSSIPSGSRVTVECRFLLLSGFEVDFERELDPSADWLLADQRRMRRQEGFDG